MSNVECIQKKGMKKSVIHGSSDSGSQTNSGQGLKRSRFNFYRNNSTFLRKHCTGWIFSRFCISATL
jgi:hypothetical protein